MIFYKHEHTIEKTLNQIPSPEQVLLKKFTNEKFSKREAQFLFEKIKDHKWYVSERLQRDVGLNVAAVDYVNNFHEKKSAGKKSGRFYNYGLKFNEIYR